MPGRISLVAGPIGNLEDITLRALRCLQDCDLIACEDTRRSRRLLERHAIAGKPLVSLHEHNEAARSSEIVKKSIAGAHIAVLSDAGMPGISDPGFRLVQKCIESNVDVEVLPGPSAIPAALAGSGLGTSRFYFGGFLPPKSGRRRTELAGCLARRETSVFFESPHRLLKSLDVLADLAPDRQICVARELTKKFETFHRGTCAELKKEFTGKPVKGEITLLIAGKSRKE